LEQFAVLATNHIGIIMEEQEFKERTKKLALRIIKLVECLPKSTASNVIGRQLLRSGTSVGANYRAACRAKSAPDMIAKLSVVEEEADETMYWLELMGAAGIMPVSRLNELSEEANQIVAMTVASIKTLRTRNQIQNPKSKI
jgi:four helix bundle protein